MVNSIAVTEQIKSMDEVPFMEPINVLERVLVQDRNYTYDMNFRYGSFVQVWGSDGQTSRLVHTTETEREPLRLGWKDAGKNDSILFVNHRRSGFSLLSEGKWIHFAWDNGRVRQISPDLKHQSYADTEILELSKDCKLGMPSDKVVFIDGVDSFAGRNRQAEIDAGSRCIQKMAIIAALDHASEAHLDFVHALLTTHAQRRG